MSITVCIPSRGRPALLRQTVETLLAGVRLIDTTISIALDEDDPSLEEIRAVTEPIMRAQTHVTVSVAPREDSLGAKWNRCARHAPASNYVIWADDMVMPVHGWDVALDGASRLAVPPPCVLFGQISGVMQPGIMVPQDLVDAMGFLAPEYFPFWWVDTWIIECAVMSARYVPIGNNVVVELLQPLEGKSRGVREIKFWADLFDALRPQRVAVAKRLNPGADTTDLEAAFRQSNRPCSDPVSAARLEAHYSFDAPADDRYMRLKAKAEKMITDIQTEAS